MYSPRRVCSKRERGRTGNRVVVSVVIGIIGNVVNSFDVLSIILSVTHTTTSQEPRCSASGRSSPRSPPLTDSF